MRASLPCRFTLARLVSAALLALGAGAPARARAFDIASVKPVRDESGAVSVQVRLRDPIEATVERTLGRGMPATLRLHAELWRRRTAWFDRLERAGDATFRMRFDVWNEAWKLERPGNPVTIVGTLDSLETLLSRTTVLPLGGPVRLPEDAKCYVVVTVELRPLNVEDAEEVEGWLSGEVQDRGGGGGLGVITGLPRSVFDAMRNFAGFGDQHVRAISAPFTIADLAVVKR